MSDPPRSADAFLLWSGDGRSKRYQLVDGEVRAKPPASATHGLIRLALGSTIRNHLVATASRCRVISEVAVRPTLQGSVNIRIPDLGVTCGTIMPDQVVVDDPILLAEILSASTKAQTWSNVWAFSTIPSLREILIVHVTLVAAQILRRSADGSWPDRPEPVGPDEVLRLQSIGLACPLNDLYADTHLRRG